MTTPFLKLVDSIDKVAKQGTDENFFQGDYYLLLPQRLVDTLNKFCLKNAKTVQLKSRDADEEEPLELFAFSIDEKSRKKVFKELANVSAKDIYSIIKQSTDQIKIDNVFSSKTNDVFDELRQISDFRDFLLKAESQSQHLIRANKNSKVAIVIYV